jgi:hypothetical protein
MVVDIARLLLTHQRRNQRIAKATLVLTQLAREGCDLSRFRQICLDAKRGAANQEEVLTLTDDATIMENAKYLIGLYARSETTRGWVDRAGTIGTSAFLREQEKALESI